MKPKDRMFPGIEEHYQLQLREVVSEPQTPRRRNSTGPGQRFVFSPEALDPVSELSRDSTITRH
jgi:hypothetical protein